MRIVIDLDGTICHVKKQDQHYADLEPVPGAAARIRELRGAGHYVIIFTARHMAACESNLGEVMRRIGKTTLDWLEKHAIEYDEIYFGKPNAEVYIDDRAWRFSSWAEVTEDALARTARPR